MFIFVLILMGTFFDYQITDTLNGHLTWFARGTEIIGEIPYTLTLMISMAFIFRFHHGKKSFFSWIKRILCLVFGYLFSYMLFFGIFRYLNPSDGNSHGEVSSTLTIVAYILALITFLGAIYLMYRLNEAQLKKYHNVAISALLFVIAVLFVTNGIKMIVGRPRYWTLEGDIANFVTWYTISGPTTTNANMSFISGHAANAFTMLSLVFVYYEDHAKAKKALMFALAWGTLVALGRLFSGQHFLTDVSFAALTTLGLFVLIYTKRLGKLS